MSNLFGNNIVGGGPGNNSNNPSGTATGFSFGAASTPGAASSTGSSGPSFGASAPSGNSVGAGLASGGSGAAPAASTFGSASASSESTPGAPAPPLFPGMNPPAPSSTASAPSSTTQTAAEATTSTTPGVATGATAFSFGAATAPSASQAPATSTGANIFGGANPLTSAPGGTPATGFKFGTSADSPAASAAAPQHHATLIIPSFDETFHNLALWTEIRRLCKSMDTSPLVGQEMASYVMKHVRDKLQIQIVELTAPDNNLRQQLSQKPVVGIDRSDPVKVVTINHSTLQNVLVLATDLRISESHAFCLYQQVANEFPAFQNLMSSTENAELTDWDAFDQIQSVAGYNDIMKLASQFYFFERHLRTQSILLLLQKRLSNDPAVLVATDRIIKEGRLIHNLIKLIQGYTLLIDELGNAIRTTSVGDANMGGNIPASGHNSVLNMHLLFCLRERQMAAESLVFVAYHTQWEVSEVTFLIDTIRHLSDKTPKLSPISNEDVADPFEDDGTPSLFQSRYKPFSLQPKEKTHLKWQKDTVELISGRDQIPLMQCNSLLLVAAVSAMDTKHVLFDRNLNAPNVFGVGNALLPPDNPAMEDIRALYEMFRLDVGQTWTRKDIWGLLVCSFAMLLRSAPSVVTSPAKGGSTGQFPKEIREAARFGMDVPMDAKSFTFCRLTLIPILQRLKSPALAYFGDIAEFSLAVVTDFYVTYLTSLVDGDLPNSRRRWQNEEEEELKLRQEEQDSQRRFEFWAGNVATTQEEKIPSVVNLMTRPECLDDLIALASTFCSLGWNFAKVFWGKDEDSGRLVASRILLECMNAAAEDKSLEPSVLSWMASLSANEESSNAIFDLLCDDSSTAPNGAEDFCKSNSWRSLISYLRYYGQKLSTNELSSGISRSATSTKSTSYYFDLTGSMNASHGASAGLSTAENDQLKGQSRSANQKSYTVFETFRFTSYLAVIMNTSVHCARARRAILGITLPVTNGELVTGEDDALVVLFTFVMAPVTSPVRGATLSTIATLLQLDPKHSDAADNESFFQKHGRNAWDYVESSTLLPIALMDRYASATHEIQSGSNLSFAPSSEHLARSIGETTAVLPNDPKFGLVYEMEHIEAKQGWYPATEGFLDLLNALVCVAGCPSGLGENWRARTGCTPYIEYVSDFIIPRALGINGMPPLSFRVLGDQFRLVAKALAVIDTVLTRYDLSPLLLEIPPGPTPSAILGLKAIAQKVSLQSSNLEETEVAKDFVNLAVPIQPLSGPREAGRNAANPSTSISVPVAKSPGFTVLAELLSPQCGGLLLAVCSVLTEHGGPRGVVSIAGDQSSTIALAYALFGSTPPSRTTAKYSSDTASNTPIPKIIQPIVPRLALANVDETFFDDGLSWRETTIETALNILCTASVREHVFATALSSVHSPPLKLTPVLRFENTKPGISTPISIDLRTIDVKANRLKDLLFSIENSRHIRSTVVEYIGYSGSTDSTDTAISSRALSLTYYMLQSSTSGSRSEPFMGDEMASRGFTCAVSRRLVLSSKRLHVPDACQVLRMILNWILVELRERSVSEGGITQILLGLPTATQYRDWTSIRPPQDGAIGNCFDAILDILDHGEIVLCSVDGSEVGSLCYEIFFRIYDLLNVSNPISYKICNFSAIKLRQKSFWNKSLQKLSNWNRELISPDHLTSLYHTKAWLLKGIASELRLLVGFANDYVRQSSTMNFFEPHPTSCNNIMACLYGSDQSIMKAVVEDLQLSAVRIDLQPPPPEALKATGSTYNLAGPGDAFQHYELVDAKAVLSWMTARTSCCDAEDLKLWIDEWNHKVQLECAVAHLSDGISTLVCASVFAALSMESYQPTLLSHSGRNSNWMQNGGAQSLLECILQKLDIATMATAHQGMDSVLIPVATKNLGNSVLLLSEFMAVSLEQQWTSPGILVQLGVLVARAIHFSCIGDDGADSAALRHERSIYLGGSLEHLMNASALLDSSYTTQYRSDFEAAARGLTRLCCFPYKEMSDNDFKNRVEKQEYERRGLVSKLSRCFLSSLIRSINDEESAVLGDSFVWSTLSRSFVFELLALVKQLDEDVSRFLGDVAMQPFGSELLVAAGIWQSLRSAAEFFATKGDNQNSGTNDYNYREGPVRTPRFLLGHLKLMCTLLSSASGQLQEDKRHQCATECIHVLRAYGNVVQRMYSSFPQTTEHLLWVLRCLVLSRSVLHSVPAGVSMDDRFNRSFVQPGFLGPDFINLIKHLLENPLPMDMLRGFPTELVPGSTKSDRSWWDLIPTQNGLHRFDLPATKTGPLSLCDTSKRWTDSHYKYGIAASKICRMGLELLVWMDIPIETPDLARGIYRTMSAAGMVGGRVAHLLSQNASSLMDIEENLVLSLEKEYICCFADALDGTSEEALIMSLSVANVKENHREGLIVSAIKAVSGELPAISDDRRRLISIVCGEMKSGGNTRLRDEFQ